MRSRLAPLPAAIAALFLILIAAASVSAYSGQVAALVLASGPSGPQPCGTPITVTATVEDIDGNPIEGQPVTWSFLSGNVSGDTILDTSTTTNASGVATTQMKFACTPHSVRFQAAADAATGTGVLGITGEGLPRTDTATDSSFPAIALAALAVLIGSATILRRFATDRR